MGSCFSSLTVFRRSLTRYAPRKLPRRTGIGSKFTQCRSLTFQVYHFCAPLNLACCFFATAVVGLNWRLDILNVWICDPVRVVRHSWRVSLLEVSGLTCSSSLRVSLWTCWSAVKFPACKRKLALSLLRRTYQARSSQSVTFKKSAATGQVRDTLRLFNIWNTGAINACSYKSMPILLTALYISNDLLSHKVRKKVWVRVWVSKFERAISAYADIMFYHIIVQDCVGCLYCHLVTAFLDPSYVHGSFRFH